MEKNKNSLLQRALKTLEFFTKVEQAKEKFEAVKVVDSEELVEYSELVVGAEVYVSSSEGSVPANDGDYKLVNGAEIKVSEGKISEVVKEADEAKEETVEEVKEEMEEETAEAPDHSEEIRALKNKVAGLEEALKTVLDTIEVLPKKESVEQFNANVKALAKLPAEKSADTRVEQTDSIMDKYNAIAKMYSK